VNTIGTKDEEEGKTEDKQTNDQGKSIYLVVDECSISRQNILNSRKISILTSNDQPLTQS
jgi:hypothetical protein